MTSFAAASTRRAEARFTCVSITAAPRSPTTSALFTMLRKIQTRGETGSSLPYVRGPKGVSMALEVSPAHEQRGEDEGENPPARDVRDQLELVRHPERGRRELVHLDALAQVG